jgi:hypothetical protein
MMARTKISPFLEAEPPSEASKYADALLAILAFIVGDRPNAKDSPFAIASRALGLAFMLRPDLTGDLDSIAAIAKHCAVTRQSLSSGLMRLRDVCGWAHCRHYKREEARAVFGEAAKRGWKTRIA